MRRYSAAEAIGPAWEHTTALLWRPRNWPTLLKLTTIAFFAEISGFGFSGGGAPPTGGSTQGVDPKALIELGVLVLFLFAIGLVIGLAMLYLGSRLQFVLFDVVVRRYTTIGPIWRHHGSHTWRWVGLKLLFFLAAILVLLPAIVPFIISMMHMPHTPPGQLPPHFFSTFFSFLAFFFLAILLIIATYWALRDFVLPSIALEDVSIGTALARARDLFRAEPGAIFGYLALRLVLSFAFGIVCEVALVITAAISSLPFVTLGLLLWLPFRHASHATRIVPLLGIGVLVAIYLVWFVLLAIVFLGTLLTFYQAWAAYFLGGRYPILGELLEPSPAITPFTPPPSLPGKDEDDNTSGPSFPLNPLPVS